MYYDRTIVGYHGCTIEVAERVLRGESFVASANAYDWLGEGIYFWEFGRDRALRWARERHGDNAAVVGAWVQLGNCFDLMDTCFTSNLGQAARAYVDKLEADGEPIPHNRGGADLKARFFDCAVINWYLRGLEAVGDRYQTVRCGFHEGPPAFQHGALALGIYSETHVQVAVRDPKCIVGVFRPLD